jgi:plasmid stability protein
MAELLITELDDRLRAGLQRLADGHGRTVAEEARDILRRAVGSDPGKSASEPGGLGTRMAANFAGIGLDFEIPELRGQIHPQVPNFDSPDFDP